MKITLRSIILFTLVVIITAACATPQSTPATQIAQTATSTSAPPFEFEGIHAFANGITFTNQDFFDDAIKDPWIAEKTKWENGEAVIMGAGEWNSYLTLYDEAQPNYGVTVRMKFEQDAVFNVALESGVWGEDSYREVGMIFEGEQAEGIISAGKLPYEKAAFNDPVALLADKWYVVSYYVNLNGDFLVAVWQEDNLNNHGYFLTALDESDRQLNWRFVAMTYRKNVYVDSVEFFSFDALRDPANVVYTRAGIAQNAPNAESAAPTSTFAPPTATSIPPTATPMPVSFSQGVKEGRIEILKNFGFGGFMNDVEFSPDGKFAAQATPVGIYLYEVDSNKPPVYLPTDISAARVAFSGDSGRMVYGNRKNIVVWDIANNKKTAEFPAHEGYVWAVAMSPDGKFIASSGYNGKGSDNGVNEVSVWSVEDFSLVKKNSIYADRLRFTPDGSILFASSNFRMITLVCCEWGMSGVIDELLPASGSSRMQPRMKDMDVSPDGTLLAIAYQSYSYIGVYDISTSRMDLKTLIQVNPANEGQNRMALGYINSVSFSPDGEKIAFTGKMSGVVKTEDGMLVKSFENGGFNVDYSPLGETILYDVNLRDARSLDQVKLFWGAPYTKEDTEIFTKHGIFPSGKWSVEVDEEKGTLTLKQGSAEVYAEAAHKPSVSSFLGIRSSRSVADIAIASDETFFVTGGFDRTVKLWHVAESADAVLVGSVNSEVGAVAISPDGKLVAVGYGEGRIIIWDISGNKPQVVLQMEHKNDYQTSSTFITRLAFSNDGEILASGGYGQTLKIWQVSDGALLGTFPHNVAIEDMQFSEDGTILYTGGRGVTRWWGVNQ